MKTLILAVTLVLAGGGCVVRGHGSGHARVDVAPGHIHDDGCGHYQHRGQWSHQEGHRHGSSCGHEYRSGMWISVR